MEISKEECDKAYLEGQLGFVLTDEKCVHCDCSPVCPYMIRQMIRFANDGKMTESEKVIEDLKQLRLQLIEGDKTIEYYQSQVDILTNAIKQLMRLS